MEITFQTAPWTDVWVQIEFVTTPTPEEQQSVAQILESWYTLGLLGSFNTHITPVQDAEVDDFADFVYPYLTEPLPSYMHNMSDIVYEDTWIRCCFDLGTADPLALDMLINALQTFSKEYAPLSQIMIGGEPEG